MPETSDKPRRKTGGGKKIISLTKGIMLIANKRDVKRESWTTH